MGLIYDTVYTVEHIVPRRRRVSEWGGGVENEAQLGQEKLLLRKRRWAGEGECGEVVDDGERADDEEDATDNNTGGGSCLRSSRCERRRQPRDNANNAKGIRRVWQSAAFAWFIPSS